MTKDSFVKFIGENIYLRRKDLDLTQEELADKVGVTQDTISRVENGTTPPKFEKLPDYAGALGCSVLDLFRTPDEDMKEYAATITDIIRGMSPQNQKRIMNIVGEIAQMMGNS